VCFQANFFSGPHGFNLFIVLPRIFAVFLTFVPLAVNLSFGSEGLFKLNGRMIGLKKVMYGSNYLHLKSHEASER